MLYVAVLDGGVVVGYEELLEELNCQSTLTNAAVPNDDQLEGHEVVIIRWSCHAGCRS